MADHQEEVRHRLEAVARRARALSRSLSLTDAVRPTLDSLAPASPTAVAAAAARADGSHGTTSSGAAPAPSGGPHSPPTVPSSPRSPQSPSSHEPEPFPSLPEPEPEPERWQAIGGWRSQDPFDTQLRSRSRSSLLSPSPSSDKQDHPFFSEPEQLPDTGESPEERPSRHDRLSIPFEAHANEDQPDQERLASLFPFVQAIMAFEKGRKFSTGTSVYRRRKMSTLVEKEGAFGPALTVCSFPLMPRQCSIPLAYFELLC